MLLIDVVRAMQKTGVRFAVAGGYAVSLHGAVRGTVDLDIVVSCDERSYLQVEQSLQSIGLQSRLPVSGREVFQFRREYIDNRQLVGWSFCDPRDPRRLVDVVITFEKKTVPVKWVMVERVRVPILEKRALIQMKRHAGRPQDLEDIKALEALS